MSLLGYATVHGTQATFRTRTPGTYDPEAGSSSDATVDVTVNGVLYGYTAQEVGEGIDADDKKFLVPASELSADPTTEDLVIFGSEIWEIVRPQRIDKHGVAEAYLLQIRRVK
jgi:hypothetical protein